MTSATNNDRKLERLTQALERLYQARAEPLLFHGWHHILFVSRKSVTFANELGANPFYVQSAALVHDLNYLVRPYSPASEGAALRKEILEAAGYQELEVTYIEGIVCSAATENRSEHISPEAKALSDADTLFKALPITPVLFSSKFLTENKVDITKLAKKILAEQKPLLEGGFYFYTKTASEKYLPWAKANIQLWEHIMEALGDSDVTQLLDDSRRLGVL